MRVLVISHYDDSLVSVRPEGELLIGLHKAGVELTVMTQGQAPYADEFRKAGIRVIDFHPTKKWDAEAVRRIRQALQDYDIQILHLFNNKAIVNGIRAARGLPVKVLTYRGYAGNIHWWDPTAYFGHLHPRVSRITCVSDAVKEEFERQLFFPKGKAVTVSKGHNPAWYENIAPADLGEFHFAPGQLIVAVVANARRMKGIPYLLEAIRLLPKDTPLRFLFIGRGLDSEQTQRFLAQHQCTHLVHFAGFRADVLHVVQACDLSLLPSVKGEGLSKVLLESLFLGKPTIMTDIGGNRGLCIPGQTALVVPPRNPKAMAEALVQLGDDQELRQKLGPAGRAYVHEHYTTRRSVAELLAVYEEVVDD